jgi:hypothetical protein
MNLLKSAIVALLLLPLAALARTPPPAPCKPCGAWQLDVASSDVVEPAVDAALAKYKPRRPRRVRGSYGDVRSETEAEFENSLIERPGADRGRLRENLLTVLHSPAELRLRQDGEDIVIETPGGPTQRVTPGEPHARVDLLGTAEIVSRLRGSTLTITEKYDVRKVSNREVYAVDAGTGHLLVTRSVTRPGLKEIVVKSTYSMH